VYTRNSLVIRIATCLLIAVISGIGMLMTPATANAETRYPVGRGCPWDAFCIYPQKAGWNNDHPSYVFYMWYPPHQWGTPHVWYNLHGQYGIHKVYNNTGCATVSMNKGYNGAGSSAGPYVFEGKSYDWDLTPYNSVTLWDDHGTRCHTK
jgi:hypothetical protein